MIDCFDMKYAFLSNFYWNDIEFDGIIYPTNEHFFQAMKTLNEEERIVISNCRTPGQAKRMGRKVTLRSDWEDVKVAIMKEGLYRKFSDEQLADWLLETGNHELVEGNHWHDQFWGVCYCEKCANVEGENMLGRLLMEIRDELREERGLVKSSF